MTFDRIVTILRQGVAVDDGYTKKPGPWVTVATRKAKVIISRGREVFENQGIEASVPRTFLLRHDSVTRGITPVDRIEYEGVQYDLKSMSEIGRGRGIECVGVARPK